MPSLDRPDGARIAYRVSGSGPALLFVHGGTGTGAFDWEYQVEHFAREWRTVVMDLRAHGDSTDPADLLALESIGDDAAAVADAVGGVAAAIGFSIGASAVLARVAHRPQDRFARALVCLGASMRGQPDAVPGILAGGWPADLVALRHVASDDPEHWRGLRRRLARTWAEDLLLTAPQLAAIDIPVLMVNGERDRIEPAPTARQIASLIPGSELAIIENAGHLAQREQPAQFNAVVSDFLARRVRPLL